MTARTPADFDQALATTRRPGDGIVHGEAVIGMSTVAAPVRDLSGKAYAAISVAAPTLVLRPELERTSRLLISAARQLSRMAAG